VDLADFHASANWSHEVIRLINATVMEGLPRDAQRALPGTAMIVFSGMSVSNASNALAFVDSRVVHTELYGSVYERSA
jgi:hypothetical protein